MCQHSQCPVETEPRLGSEAEHHVRRSLARGLNWKDWSRRLVISEAIPPQSLQVLTSLKSEEQGLGPSCFPNRGAGKVLCEESLLEFTVRTGARHRW